MPIDRSWIVVALLLVLGAATGCKKTKKPPPIEFQGKLYVHVQAVTHNKLVTNHFYTVDGVPVPKSTEWIQITMLADAVTKPQRARIEAQIKASMRVRPLPGSSDRFFGVVGREAVYVIMLDGSYVFYVHERGGKDAAELRGGANDIIDALLATDYGS